YCRLMLILFQPWSIHMGLREGGQMWNESFEEFACTASKDVLNVMDNMQILHECKDS
ncbi:hypothetical protein ARMGADRAFT_932964, partial [Armillaria gallica]